MQNNVLDGSGHGGVVAGLKHRKGAYQMALYLHGFVLPIRRNMKSRYIPRESACLSMCSHVGEHRVSAESEREEKRLPHGS